MTEFVVIAGVIDTVEADSASLAAEQCASEWNVQGPLTVVEAASRCVFDVTRSENVEVTVDVTERSS